MLLNSMNFIPVNVSTNSGLRSGEVPESFVYEGIEYIISEINDRWYQIDNKQGFPVSDYFKVVTSEQNIFMLKHEMAENK
jgi:hypothetical protein